MKKSNAPSKASSRRTLLIPRPPSQESKSKNSRNNKKTSTPTKDEDMSLFCDMSQILPFNPDIPGTSNQIQPEDGNVSKITLRETKGKPLTRSKSLSNDRLLSKDKTRSKDTGTVVYSEEDIACAISNFYLQSVVARHLVEKCNEKVTKEVDESLHKLQMGIEEEVERSLKLKEKLHLIRTNNATEKLLRLHEKTYGNLIENLKEQNVSPVKQKCDAVSKNLEEMQNKIVCENITVPETAVEIENLIAGVKEAFINLTPEVSKQGVDEELVTLINKTFESAKEFKETSERCEENLPEMQSLSLKVSSLQIMRELEKEENGEIILS